MIMNILFRKFGRIITKLTNLFYIYYNRLKFRVIGVEFGRNLKVYNKLYLTKFPNSLLSIGDNFVFSSGGCINPLCRNLLGAIFLEPGSEIMIGNNSGVSSACLWAKKKIVIGNGVNVGGDCIIMDSDAHSLDWRIRAGLVKDESGRIVSDTNSAKSSPIIIEDTVLIGTRCIILKGVTIGARSIIAAGSVVTKSIPADCVAGGNPCRVIRKIDE